MCPRGSPAHEVVHRNHAGTGVGGDDSLSIRDPAASRALAHGDDVEYYRISELIPPRRPRDRKVNTCFPPEREGGGAEKAENETHISEVFQNVEEVFCLFVLIAALDNGIGNDQVFGDFGPHIVVSGLLGRAAPPVVADFNLQLSIVAPGGPVGGSRGWGWSRLVTLRNEPGPPNAIVALPSNLGGAATHAVHADALGAGRDVDNGPIAGGAVPGLSHAAAGINI